MGDSTEEAAMKSFLDRFLEEFPAALGPDEPLPLCPLSRNTLSLDELPGESLELGLRLTAARRAPAALGAMMCHEALAQLLKSDLSPLHCPQQPEAERDEDQGVLVQSEAAQRLFLNQLREVAAAWHRGLPALPPAASSSSSSRGRYLLCSVHAIRNTRRKMEDKHVSLPEFNQLFGLQDGVERAYYGVFDGHGGLDAATYAAAHLHVALNQQKALHKDPDGAFKSAFHRTDHMFRGKALRERLRSGSTGVAVLLQGDSLSVAWLGDSQAMLVRRGQPVTLMDPHKPEREDEKQRIEDLGGCIAFMGCWRVNGTYAVSRAIGDFDQKPYVSGDADCSTVQLDGDEDYLLLACDGFFDTVTLEEVPGIVLGALREPREDPEEGGDAAEESALGESVAQKLVAHAKAAGSNDNITVLVVFLRPPEQLLVEDSSAAATEATENSNSQSASGQ